MHSRIFQFEQVKKKEFDKNDITLLDESLLEKNNFPDPSCVDYWCDSDEPKEDFKWFVACLPKGMFKVDRRDCSLTYIQKPIGYIQKFIDTIQEEANKLNIETFFTDKFSTWKLQRVLDNNENDFMIYEDNNGYPIYCSDWIMFIARNCEIGTKFYLGGVLDYHF